MKSEIQTISYKMNEIVTQCKDEKNGHAHAVEDVGVSSVEIQDSDENAGLVFYTVNDPTAPHLAAVFGLQQVLLSISSTISVPLIVAAQICAGELELVKSQILSTFLFMCGVCTILQVILGVRLPIIQGGCHKFIPAIMALMSLPIWQCPDMTRLDPDSNVTEGLTDDQISDIWKSRMREIQGGILTSAFVQVFIGCTGLLGFILQYVGPITILPTITLVGLSLIDVALGFCEKHWGISSLTILLVLLFSLIMNEVRVPLPAFNKEKKCHITRYPIFKLLPVLLAVGIAWSVCVLLTVTDKLSNDPDSLEYYTRTDARTEALYVANWFYFPYPGQWGAPTYSFSSFMAMLTATIASIIESVGDYYACARICGERPPPVHAVNRGVAIEGIGSVISGAIGSGGATTSYSQNVGAIGFTKVASRRAFIGAGVVFILCGICGKFGALLTMIPDPVLGGILFVSFGMVTSVGLSNIQFASLQSTRNLLIIGCSLLIGLMIPRYLQKYPNCIQTGNSEIDQVLTVLLSTAMFVGGFVGFVLDNIVRGTDKERGIKAWRKAVVPDLEASQETSERSKIYDIPFITDWLFRQRWSVYIPFFPTFQELTCRLGCKRSNEKDILEKTHL